MRFVRTVVILALAGGALAGLTLVGQREEARAERAQAREIEQLYAAAGGEFFNRRVTTWRIPSGQVYCLEYRVGADPYAIELCYDREGRLVEAVDRRPRIPRFWSLLLNPRGATIRIDPAELQEIFEAMGVSVDL